MNVEQVEQVDYVRRKSHAYGHVTDRIFQDQIPPDDPGHQLAHGRVGVGVGAARDRDQGRELGVAECRQATGERHQYERKRYGGSRAGAAECSRTMDEVLQHRGLPNRFCGKELPFDRCPDHREDARADHRADAERSQRDRAERLFQARLRILRIRDQLVYGLLREQLVRQVGLLRFLYAALQRRRAKGPLRITTAWPCRAPSSSLCASSSRAQPCACPWEQPSCATPYVTSCVLLWSDL